MPTNARTPKPRSTSKPAPKADFDLTKLDIVADEPLRIKLRPDIYVRFRNVKDLPWDVAARVATVGVGGLFELMQNVVVEEDFDDFIAANVSERELDHVMQFYRDHFGLVPGESVA